MKFKPLSDEKKEQIRLLRSQGMSYEDIAKELGISKGSAMKYSKGTRPLKDDIFTSSSQEAIGEIYPEDEEFISQPRDTFNIPKPFKVKDPPSPELKAKREEAETVELEVRKEKASIELDSVKRVREAEEKRTRKAEWIRLKISEAFKLMPVEMYSIPFDVELKIRGRMETILSDISEDTLSEERIRELGIAVIATELTEHFRQIKTWPDMDSAFDFFRSHYAAPLVSEALRVKFDELSLMDKAICEMDVKKAFKDIEPYMGEVIPNTDSGYEILRRVHRSLPPEPTVESEFLRIITTKMTGGINHGK